MPENKSHTTAEKAATHDVLTPLIQAMYDEFKDLSKKKPDSPISKSKIKVVNRMLKKLRTVLNDEESIEFLDLLDEDDVPQASDVTLMLSQYVAAMVSFRKKYHGFSDGKQTWFLK